MTSPADEETERRKKEKRRSWVCVEKIKKQNLSMKLIDTEHTFDNNKVLFYFTADGGSDFRELVKDLGSVLRRGRSPTDRSRDEDKDRGRNRYLRKTALLCVVSFPEFIPVSIKMAKGRNPSLNPTKIPASAAD